MARAIMIQGTASNAGKSLLAAALCRIFRQDGYRVAPFKSQNMALNSYITRDGLEMGRAQVVQAQAAGIEPEAVMNPILLKPQSDTGSQVIVRGEVYGVMGAKEYYQRKKELVPAVLQAYQELGERFDILVLEGAGSPAEINLMQDDFVNMGLARMTEAPVLLVGDIDRGGVFASLYGTLKLLPREDQGRVRGLVINKFRGDVEILRPGLSQLEELTGTPVLGVIPYLPVQIDDEDSLSASLSGPLERGVLDIVVPRLPRLSNFTDFAPLAQTEGVSVRYLSSPRQFGEPDLVLLPGTKSTMADLRWLRSSGLESVILKHAARGGAVLGICGGYQMLGQSLSDPEGAEDGGEMRGMGLLPVDTVFSTQKSRVRTQGHFGSLDGVLAPLSGAGVDGYEIHMGRTARASGSRPLLVLEDGREDGCQQGNIYGTYLHGLWDTADALGGLLSALCRMKGIDRGALRERDPAAFREEQYDLLARSVREHLDIKAVYAMLGLKGPA